MKLKLLASAAATLMAFAMPAHAEIPNIELRVGDSLPPDHIISQKLTQAWFDAVESKSNGKIKIKEPLNNSPLFAIIAASTIF